MDSDMEILRGQQEGAQIVRTPRRRSGVPRALMGREGHGDITMTIKFEHPDLKRPVLPAPNPNRPCAEALVFGDSQANSGILDSIWTARASPQPHRLPAIALRTERRRPTVRVEPSRPKPWPRPLQR